MKLFAIAFLAAFAVAAPAPVQKAFNEGETLDYDLQWMRITGATARMTIAPAGDQTKTFRITSVAKSTPGFSRIFKVRDEIETIVDAGDFSTLRYLKRLDERGRKKEELTAIQDGVATRTRQKGEKVQKTAVPRPVLDPISVVYRMRTLDLSIGKVHDLQLIADGKLYAVRAHVRRREAIQTPAGRFDTVVVEPEMLSGGVAREERLFIWYSDDDRRIPVRIRTEIKVGAITATLRSVTAGVDSREPAAAQ